MNAIKSKTKKLLFFIILVSTYGCSKESAEIDTLPLDSTNSADVSISCKEGKARFARGVRGTPSDFSPIVTLNKNKQIRLYPSCYTDISCVYYKNKPSVMLIDAPACGGNAVPEEYIVFDLNTGKKHILNYHQASKLN